MLSSASTCHNVKPPWLCNPPTEPQFRHNHLKEFMVLHNLDCGSYISISGSRRYVCKCWSNPGEFCWALVTQASTQSRPSSPALHDPLNIPCLFHPIASLH